jgi:hypothetical protein
MLQLQKGSVRDKQGCGLVVLCLQRRNPDTGTDGVGTYVARTTGRQTFDIYPKSMQLYAVYQVCSAELNQKHSSSACTWLL